MVLLYISWIKLTKNMPQYGIRPLRLGRFCFSFVQTSQHSAAKLPRLKERKHSIRIFELLKKGLKTIELYTQRLQEQFSSLCSGQEAQFRRKIFSWRLSTGHWSIGIPDNLESDFQSFCERLCNIFECLALIKKRQIAGFRFSDFQSFLSK